MNIWKLTDGASALAEEATSRRAAAVTEAEFGSCVLEEGFRSRYQHFVSNVLHWAGALKVARKFTRRYSLGAASSSYTPRLHRANQPRILILCYHRVGVTGIPFYSRLPVSVFEKQMRFLRRNYQVLSLDQACRELESPSAAETSVVVTFDDGYCDLFTQALPVLRRYEIPATIYLTVAAIETGEVAWYDRIFLLLRHVPGTTFECNLGDGDLRRFPIPDLRARFRAAVDIVTALKLVSDLRRREICRTLEQGVELPQEELARRMLTWDQIRLMQAAGLSFGCHTMSHPVVSRLSAADLDYELVESKKLLESRIRVPVRDFAFPFGKPAECGSEAQAVLKRAGYRSAVTTSAGLNVPGMNKYGLLRVDLSEQFSAAMFALQLNCHFLLGDVENSGPTAESITTTPEAESGQAA